MGTSKANRSVVASPVVADEITSAPAAGRRAGSKQALLCDLLARDGGASLVEIATATGWLPHTARAALTGLRKRGSVITKDKVDGATRWRTGASA